ncbi:lipoprotein insertase outer membrane protein LolB [Hydrogenophaga sp. OTU3427]|uniref:lipoprotein insertase outer membrane protein LolB n=1 Tax=Hydrogenophaga sp. OTU3427 TaxID=3043856 RepID=UPI00313F2C9D
MTTWSVWWRALVLVVSLAGCASSPPSMPAEHFWSGRLALRVDSTPAQSLSAGFELRGDARSGELTLLSPLGSTLAEARWSAAGAELRHGNATERYASMDELTQALTGAALPLPALFGWLRGQALVADGWQADLSGHAEGQIAARRAHPLPTAELRLRLQP